VFIFCAAELFFDDTEGVESRFHVLRCRTLFRQYRGQSVSISCFALPDSFSAAPRASGQVSMFCAPELVFSRTEVVEFSCYALPDSFSAVQSASGPFFMFYVAELMFNGTEGVGSRFHVCAPRLVFGSTKGLGCHFHVLCSRTRFRR
jgi:hypothetical protein